MVNSIKDLEKYRTIQDELSDKLVTKVYDTLDKKEIGELYKNLMDDLGELDYNKLPKVFSEYFLNNQNFPDWIDYKKITLTQNLFIKLGPEYATCLICRALPVGYTSANVVKLLSTTGYLSNDLKTGTAKRLLETSQFIFNVMRQDTFNRDSVGVKHILKVRFIHGMVRYHLIKHGWDSKKYGAPVNQQDMSLTILTFSIGAILGLERLKVYISEKEKDALVHYWAVIGSLIGVDEKINPKDYKSAKAVYNEVLLTQAKKSEEGVQLMRALSNFIKATVKIKRVPNLTDYMIRFLIGNDRYSDILGLAKPRGFIKKNAFNKSIFLVKAMNIWRGNYIIDKLIKPVNKLFIIRLLNYFDKEFDLKLSIPEEFISSWGIKIK
jgi:hypothetical protein